MENKTYIVELTPVGNYFFGSENTFNSTDKATVNSQATNYLVRSRMYPQQTTLLGIMRYLLLAKEGRLTGGAQSNDTLIGAKSFHGIDHQHPVKWGIINTISPLFLKNGNLKYFIAGNDHQFYKDEHGTEKHVLLKTARSEKTFFSFSEQSHLSFPTFDPKHHAEQLWKDVSKEDYIKPKDIFIESFQVGIKKSRTGKSDNEAFYKQFFYKLKTGFSFAFYINVDGAIMDDSKAIIIPSGADQSLFKVSLKEENSIFDEPKTPNGPAKITLISDAYIPADLLDSCLLAINDSVDFRYIRTKTSTKRYYNISKSDEDMQKSGKLNLVERGSVFYTDDPATFINALIEPDAYRNIGFNHYKIESVIN